MEYKIKRDEVAKQLDLLHQASAHSSPINMLKDALTSEGKTYPTLQISELFPKEDVWVLDGLSKTALAHDYGIPVDKDGHDLTPKLDELNQKIRDAKLRLSQASKEDKNKIRIKIEQLEEELRETFAKSHRLINMENKIIIFVENPRPETWAALRPIMSHDKWQITYKFTDRVGMKQFTAIVQGWPVFIAFKAEDESPASGIRYSAEALMSQ